MNEPRPAMISARPPESRSRVENCWNTRTGSSELSTVTALLSRMREVRSAAAASVIDGRRDGEVGPVVLADREDVEADLVGEPRLFDQVAEADGRSDRPAAGRIGRELREGVEAEFHDYLSTQASYQGTPGRGHDGRSRGSLRTPGVSSVGAFGDP